MEGFLSPSVGDMGELQGLLSEGFLSSSVEDMGELQEIQKEPQHIRPSVAEKRSTSSEAIPTVTLLLPSTPRDAVPTPALCLPSRSSSPTSSKVQEAVNVNKVFKVKDAKDKDRCSKVQEAVNVNKVFKVKDAKDKDRCSKVKEAVKVKKVVKVKGAKDKDSWASAPEGYETKSEKTRTCVKRDGMRRASRQKIYYVMAYPEATLE